MAANQSLLQKCIKAQNTPAFEELKRLTTVPLERTQNDQQFGISLANEYDLLANGLPHKLVDYCSRIRGLAVQPNVMKASNGKQIKTVAVHTGKVVPSTIRKWASKVHNCVENPQKIDVPIDVRLLPFLHHFSGYPDGPNGQLNALLRDWDVLYFYALLIDLTCRSLQEIKKHNPARGMEFLQITLLLKGIPVPTDPLTLFDNLQA